MTLTEIQLAAKLRACYSFLLDGLGEGGAHEKRYELVAEIKKLLIKLNIWEDSNE